MAVINLNKSRYANKSHSFFKCILILFHAAVFDKNHFFSRIATIPIISALHHLSRLSCKIIAL
ncbi:TPA: hypothetical protein DEG21_06150 [Patescibacteria group bacterium]|nr:hypothetical protein [Candidatus Gracilibacteria bacterium]